jgi:predicted RNA binding protein YcfA (HicA-like mRNA interferase family)
MPKRRRLTGQELVAILQQLGFEIVAIKGSHHRMRRMIDGVTQSLTIPVHGSKPLNLKTLSTIYRQLCKYVSEEEIEPRFFSE